MQILHQSLGLIGIHHKTEIQIASGLTQQVNTVFLKHFECRPDLVQHGANLLADQADYCHIR